jgi:6-phosphogluconate dehydrogenase
VRTALSAAASSNQELICCRNREASQVLAGPAEIPPPPHTLEQDIRDALLASKIISYAQVKPA